MTTTARSPYEFAPSAEEERGRLQRLIDGLPVGIYRSTPSGEILAANPAMACLLGYPAVSDLHDLNAADVYVDRADRRRWQDQMDRDGVVRAFDFRIRRPNGEIIWVRDTARAIRDDDGRVLYYEGIVEDVTEPKRVQEALRESEERARSVFEEAPIGMTIVGLDGRFLKANRALCEMLGYTADELVALTIADITHPEDNERVREERERFFTGMRALFRADRRYLRKNGQAFWAHLTARIIRDDEHRPLYALGMIEDIDEQRRARVALEEAHERLSNSMGEVKQRTERVTLLTEMTDLLQSCLTLDEAYAVLRTKLPEFFSAESGAVYIESASRRALRAVAAWGLEETDRVFSPDDCWAIRRGRHHVASDGGPFCSHLDTLRPAWSICIPMTAQGETMGVLTLARSTAWQRDAATRHEEREQGAERLFASTVAEHIALALANLRLRDTLRSQSIRDPLTGLFNRRYMEETLDRELHRAERRQVPVSVVMFDIDHFKLFNDTHGHLAGDALLRTLGEFLQAHFRGEDIVCRYGGEEFVLILPEAPLAATLQRADTLRERLKVLHVPYLGTLLGGITVSLGVACFPDHGTNAEAVLRAADAALYRAKTSGRDCVVCHEAD